MKTRLLIFLAFVAIAHAADSDFEIFIKDTPGTMIETGWDDCEARELWLLNKKTHSSELLVKDRSDRDLSKTIAGIRSPVFSPDRKSIYFCSAAWATSGSIQNVDIASKKVRFVIDGGSVEVIEQGLYAGQLLVIRYLIEDHGRDSYLWLVSSEGTPIIQIGQIDSFAVSEFLKLFLPGRIKSAVPQL